MAAMAPRARGWGITKLSNILRDKSVPLNLEYIFIINIFMAILVTTLCERAGDHGGRRSPTAAFDSLYCAQMAQTSIVVLRRCLPLRRSRDPQLIKGRWSVDRGIDYFKHDADVNVSIVAQNFLMVKMAGRSFGRKKNTVWLSPCPLSPGEPYHMVLFFVFFSQICRM